MRLGIAALLFITSAACAAGPRQGPVAYGIAERLDQGIAQLTSSIEGIDHRLLERAQVPVVQDSMEELQALDLSAWTLRRQQWILQRDHLELARRMINASKAQPDERSRLEAEWGQHSSEYLSRLDDLQRQRASLESRRLKVESQLIEQSLRDPARPVAASPARPSDEPR